ncbi:Pterin-4-alpha-carbinolamine dehydratase [uncultured Candidatus Thioglobus sp.]|uniref:4a-hydroxytetrahydrobiopterin dehydratase n=1 Tax=Bathymodiolus heckerae thiotrophic gill symbiont TaxID=1052212 RepID=UPI0010B93DD0|nr:4a-hydroxytetrahydrobiopterin dehydratase [Bathymodiolus heckerae thiotrophic gill symbiont]CAC9585987.1 Pterin-4-alpha-carbinolamine dehydratase (EC 4.2.1.96) [uncultured Gammaproteobacteria bacterium]CAC9598407.1 Pterin-4-alpha-carbinolamine dehydratase (EC 4.2.1.96) [uncultured Gammaproteobacteria bacterium]SHN89105.1 Pterin-4-alpha-carbinolamine dehydratase [Bathymodiolus heckerae thiotrophic gill symbiont]SMN15484.1 Pterin-4-alpha-carbinolamine dehydratase [uncultured Candidatus Thioglo
MIHSEILKQLPDWSIVNQKLHRRFECQDFVQAFEFMSQVAIVAEKMNHHPEWSNVYKLVDVDLTTHSQGCISELDLELAEKMNVIFKKISK